MELVVGRVVKSHGVTGEVVVEIRTDDPADRFAPGTRLRAKGPFDGGAEGSAVSYVIESVRQHGGRLLVRLAGVADRDAADALRGSLFVIDADDLPPIDEPDTYYDHQLVGLMVQTATGRVLVSSPKWCTPPLVSCWRSSVIPMRFWCRLCVPSLRRCHWTTASLRLIRPMAC